MNVLVQYTQMWENNRTQVIDYLKEKQFSRVIDIGASADSWANEFMTHYMDIVKMNKAEGKTGFIGNICDPEAWDLVLSDVETNGMFDFAICTHTLEDICNPSFVCKMISKIAKRGFAAVPSKYFELKRHEGPYRGWQHHRWIYNKEGNDVVAYPKLAFTDHMHELDQIVERSTPAIEELQWFWQRSMDLKIVNNDYLGPSPGHVRQYYLNLLNP